ncbi:unnamed protein product [Prunus brigantina]
MPFKHRFPHNLTFLKPTPTIVIPTKLALFLTLLTLTQIQTLTTLNNHFVFPDLNTHPILTPTIILTPLDHFFVQTIIPFQELFAKYATNQAMGPSHEKSS